MGVNEHGVVACLLNFYLPGESLLPDTSGRYRSRGEIIPRALALGSMDDVLAWITAEFDPALYPSFALHLISPDRNLRFTWVKEGAMERHVIPSGWTVFSSSGWDSAEVARWREEQFQRWLEQGAPTNGSLPAFHVLQESGHEERSPLMKRPWSATRSITQALVVPGSRRIELAYWPQPTPATVEPAERIELPLIADAARTAVSSESGAR